MYKCKGPFRVIYMPASVAQKQYRCVSASELLVGLWPALIGPFEASITSWSNHRAPRVGQTASSLSAALHVETPGTLTNKTIL